MDVTVLQLSDTHLTDRPGGLVGGSDPDLRLGKVLETWLGRKEALDLILLTGDEADDASPSAYRRLANALASLDAPIVALAGNHDSPSEIAAVFGNTNTVEVGSWRIVGLNSSRPGEVRGTIDVTEVASQLDSLDDRPTIIAIHHPPVSRSSNTLFGLDGADALLRDLAYRSHVKAILSGHVHDAFDLEGIGGLALLGCPSTLVAICHSGKHHVRDENGLTGARALRLHEDGTFDSELVIA